MKVFMQLGLLVFSISLLAFSCDKSKKEEPILQNPSFVKISFDLLNLSIHNGFNEAENRGKIERPSIDEASGLAVSRSNPKRIWTHNDKGGANRLYVLGTNGEDYGYFWIWGTGNRDWEDICIGPGPTDGKSYIYIGDIGDNDAVYPNIIISRFIEPDISGLDSVGINSVPAENVERLSFVYPDGSKDAETLMIDPWTKDLFIVTKREKYSSVYVAKYPYSTTEVNTLTKIAELPFNRALAGDISSDGKEIVIKTDNRLYYWKREIGETILEALQKTPLLLPYFVEPQGESFAWTPNANGYYTLSEKNSNIIPSLYFYSRK